MKQMTGEGHVTSEIAERLVALLRIVERQASYGVLGDDAVLDAWFGARSPADGSRPRSAGLEWL